MYDQNMLHKGKFNNVISKRARKIFVNVVQVDFSPNFYTLEKDKKRCL